MTKMKRHGRTPEPPAGVKLIQTLRGHTAGIGRIAWSPMGQVLVSPSEDGTIRIWNTETGKCLRELRLEGRPVTAVLDARGEILAVGCLNGAVSSWDINSGRLLWNLAGPESAGDPRHGASLAFHPQAP